MAAPPSTIHSIGDDVLGSVRDTATGALLVQLGDVTVEQPESQEAEVWQQCGFASRPAAATQGKSAAQAVCIRRSDRDVCIALRDSRALSMYGNLQPAETCAFASTGQARTLWKADGSITTVTTTTNDTTGTTIVHRIDPTGLAFSTPFGGISFTSAGCTIYLSDGTYVQLTSGTVTINAKTVNVLGGQVNVGAAATAATPALTGPLPVIGGASGVATPSTTVFISP